MASPVGNFLEMTWKLERPINIVANGMTIIKHGL